MPTAQAMLNTALRQLGVIASGDTPTAEEYNDCLDVMNNIIETWQADERAFFSQNDATFAITTSTGQYAVGDATVSITGITRSGTTATATTAVRHSLESGNKVTVAGAVETDYNITATVTVTGPYTFTYTIANSPTSPATGTMSLTNANFNVARPVELLGAFTRASGVDTPLGIITERYWDSLADKARTSSLASKILYRPNYPFGQILMYPVPTAAATLHAKTRNTLYPYTSLTQDQAMPPGYRRALELATSIDAAPQFGSRVQPESLIAVTNSYKTLWELNTKKPVSSKDNLRSAQAVPGIPMAAQ